MNKCLKPEHISEECSCVFSTASFFAACLIVCHHINWRGDSCLLGWFVETYIGKSGLASSAVPLFFFMSGYFLAGHVLETNWWRREVSKRIRTLLVPLILWTIIGVTYFFLRSVVVFAITNRPIGEAFHYNNFAWWCYMLGLDPSQGVGGNGPLWYLRALFLFVMISPIIVWLQNRIGSAWLAIMGGACLFLPLICRLLGGGVCGDVLYFGFPLIGFFCFAVGIRMRFMRLPPLTIYAKFTLMICGLVSLWALSVLRQAAIAKTVNVAFVLLPFTAMSIVIGASFFRIPRWLLRTSFPLFVSHWFVVTVFPRAYQPTFGANVILFAGSLLFSIVLSFLLIKRTSRLGHVLFGAR